MKIDENDANCQHDDTCSRYSSKYPLPIVLASKTIWQLIQSKGSHTSKQPRLMGLNSDPNTRWVEANRPVLVKVNPDHQSRYYRSLVPLFLSHCTYFFPFPQLCYFAECFLVKIVLRISFSVIDSYYFFIVFFLALYALLVN